MLDSWFRRIEAVLEIRTVKDDETGQGLVEYALILVLIAVVTIAALTALGTNLIGLFNDIAGLLPT